MHRAIIQEPFIKQLDTSSVVNHQVSVVMWHIFNNEQFLQENGYTVFGFDLVKLPRRWKTMSFVIKSKVRQTNRLS